MTVYVDSMRSPYGRLVMCHMLADTDEELHAMADKIGVARRWHQKAGRPHSHYDICMSKRAIAVRLGAVEISRRAVAEIIKAKRQGGIWNPTAQDAAAVIRFRNASGRQRTEEGIAETAGIAV